MRLIGYERDGVRRIGAVEGDQIRDLASMSDFYRAPGACMRATGKDRIALGAVRQVPPVPEAARVFCVAINYRAHAEEAMAIAGLEEPKLPEIFGRWASTLVVDGDPVPVPPLEPGLDWEVELAVIIGDRVLGAKEETALEHVLGYTVFNDLTARHKQTATRQFTLGKNADYSGPIGPVIVTADEIGDAGQLALTTRVNGEVMQDANTRDLIHSVARVIAYISDTVTLQPGDVIATGTPSGVGFGHTPPTLMKAGDVVEVEIEKIGKLTTPIVSREAAEQHYAGSAA